MAVVIEDGPSGGAELVGRAVSDLAPPSRVERLTAAVTRGSAARVSRPLPLYTLGIADLEEDRPLAAASLSGWRYLAWNGREARAVDLAGSAPELLRLNQMLGAAATARLIEACERVGGANQLAEETRLRILAVPSLQMEALWVARDGAADSFLLLRLPGDSSVREIDFLDEARELIAIRRESAAEAMIVESEPSELGA